MRPALERLRDGAVEGSFEVVLCHSPDRLARRYAYQVLLLDELARAGVEVIFAFEDERAQTPEGELLRQMQNERAQIAERTRRGRLHRARSGSAAVLWPRALWLPVRASLRARRRVLPDRRGQGAGCARCVPPLRA